MDALDESQGDDPRVTRLAPAFNFKRPSFEAHGLEMVTSSTNRDTKPL